MDTYTESERLQGKPRNYSTVVSAFSGIGGLDLGVSAAIPTRTLAYIEREITCGKILAQRAAQGLLDDAPIYSDVKSFPTELFAGKVDIDFLLSGFPCQPFSVAGKQEGSEDERNLWPDTLRLIRSLRPRYAFMENVPGLVSHEYFGTILGDLAEAGYDAEWGCFTASEIGASHRRERVFILAHANNSGSLAPEHGIDRHGQKEDKGWDGQPFPEPSGQGNGLADPAVTGLEGEEHRVSRDASESSRELAHANSSGSKEYIQQAELWTTGTEQSPCDSRGTGQGEDEQVERRGEGDIYRPELPEFPPGPGDSRWGWIIEHYPELSPSLCKVHEAEPTLCNMDDAGKITDRVAALMMLGNAVVPQQAEHAFRTLASRINDAG